MILCSSNSFTLWEIVLWGANMSSCLISFEQINSHLILQNTSRFWYLWCASGPDMWFFLAFYVSFFLFRGLHTFFFLLFDLPLSSNLCPQPLPHRRSACLQPFGITSPRLGDLNFLSPLKKTKKTVKARFHAVLLSEFLDPDVGCSNRTRPQCLGISPSHLFGDLSGHLYYSNKHTLP